MFCPFSTLFLHPEEPQVSDPQKQIQENGGHTFSTRIQRPHIKNINPLHLPQDFQSFQSRALIEIRRHGAWFGPRG